MDNFRVFAEVGGEETEIGNGSGNLLPHVGDEIKTSGVLLTVYRRVFDADAKTPEWHLYVRRI